MVLETMKETGECHGAVTRIAVQLGLGSETLRHWVKQAEIDDGQRPGITTAGEASIVAAKSMPLTAIQLRPFLRRASSATISTRWSRKPRYLSSDSRYEPVIPSRMAV